MSEQQQPPEADPIMTVPASTLQNILNYLAVRPYQEVSVLIDLLRNTAKLPESEQSESGEA